MILKTYENSILVLILKTSIIEFQLLYLHETYLNLIYSIKSKYHFLKTLFYTFTFCHFF